MNIEKLKGFVPDKVIAELPSIAKLDSDIRLAHFLSQCSHESAHFMLTQENLSYSTSGLLKTFPKYFTSATAPQYAKQPQKIANRVYSNRMGNGDETSGEGWKYHGRGFIQLTGKDNYMQFGTYIGENVVANPDLVASKYPLASAGFFFTVNSLWSICDKGKADVVVSELTKRINGGYIGLADRLNNFKTFANILGL